MPAPHYKLIYFDIKGLGECIKYIFSYKGIEYESERVILFTAENVKDSPWFEMKATMPFGQLPVLEVDGKRLYQSMAICLYLAGQHGLLAGDSWKDAELVALAGSLMDLTLRVARFFYERDLEKRAELKIEREEKMLPFYLERFENILQQNGDFYAGKLTWFDFYIVAGFETINGMMGKDHVTGKYPALEGLMKRVWNLPKVKEYIADRPPATR